MYLVDFSIFNKFVSDNCLSDNGILPAVVPAIVEYRKGGILMAKIEVTNFKQFNYLRKYGAKLTGKVFTENKYWIRGNEWKTIDNQVVMELAY